ncbi:MAG: glycoside hydrolase family 15 protein [Bdellovibrionaceae bacterium]|nr:glycoside hydrolase family 15 protein [Pseudobdellovibrionaceae bacterium]
MSMYNYGLIGNCQISALIGNNGSIDWLCLPRPDSEPVFGKILDPDGGSFSIVCTANEAQTNLPPPIQGQQRFGQQHYLENTNILITEMEDSNGSRFRVTDFCPRFEQHGRMFRPLMLIRMVEPLTGTPMIRVNCKPVQGWNKEPATHALGSNHLRFDMRDDSLRVTTTMPLTYLTENTPFMLKEKTYFTITWGSPIQDDLVEMCERFYLHTRDYWRTWVKHCSVPTLFQSAVIRSALALKLHVFEDTGAILAALTTSLPEEPGNTRNWDYRFCWLRDSYFVLSAFHNLGHFEEMEGFLRFLLNIAIRHEEAETRLAPVYTLNQGLPVPEIIHDGWKGFKNSGPVRSNNQAAEHVQNDVYGEMVLTLSPIFFDDRFKHLRTKEHQELLVYLGRLCAKTISQPDAGLWEVRDGWQEHTFSNLMCWAGLERIERIQKLGYCLDFPLDASAERFRAEQAVGRAIKDGYLRNGPQDDSLDSALALLPILRFPGTDLAAKTVEQIRRTLAADGEDGSFLFRYLRRDDFGTPHSAFVICSFWIAQSLAMLGKREEACRMLETVSAAANPLGLYAEHFLPERKLQLGNFPQAYSHVGLINAAFAASPPWSQIL